jgi:hypothetical protein
LRKLLVPASVTLQSEIQNLKYNILCVLCDLRGYGLPDD